MVRSYVALVDGKAGRAAPAKVVMME